MKWLENFALVMRSSINGLREKIEDPERLLRQLLIDMEEELERVRASVAGAIADEILLGRKVEKARQESAQWHDRAAQAWRRREEGISKSALEQKILAGQRVEALEREHARQKEETAKLRQAVSDLEDKIRQARQKQTLLLARLARADSASRINRALERTQSRSAFAQFLRLEEKVERAETLEQAYQRLEGHDPGAEDLERQFREEERKERLENEFEELKRRLEPEEKNG
ncbi:MAG: PspA/IM30 family protein [Planctomycetes bacterium]|nr:PspA/IM30 family protein [Planctomycetota bacterium]